MLGLIISIIVILLTLIISFVLGMEKHTDIREKSNFKPEHTIPGGEEEKDDFPYKKYSIKKLEIMERFKNLQNYKPEFIKTNYKINNMQNLQWNDKLYKPDESPIILKYNSDDYLKYNLISDYFTEKCRILAKRYDQELSPFDYWNKNKKQVIKYAKIKYGKADKYSLRESIFELSPEATTFRPTNMVAMIRKYNAKKVLDFSSGWGDRLIAAMACDVEYYCGVDPNSCLHKHYPHIINTFNSLSETKVNMIQSPFENAQLPDMTFDMIFTSPPYFNLEKYSAEETQSISKYAEKDEWYDKFLLFSLKKSWNVLDKNGHMIIVINNFRDIDIISQMLEDVQKFNNVEFLGVISYAEVYGNKIRSPQPMWIWKKI